jgi:nucleoside phosphorylase
MACRLRRDEYTVGWVCALPVELAAAQEMLDEEHDAPPSGAYDTNIYTCGRVGEHNVVIACLPEGQTGTHSAATVAAQMRLAFTSARFGLMVGIGGGVPSKEADIRLGDVVVSKPHKVYGGVVQYDSGKATPSGFERTGSLNTPPTILLNAVTNLRAKHIRGRGRLGEYLSKLDIIPKFTREAAGPDTLFAATYDHEGGGTCRQCDTSHLADREPRRQEVVVHYGTIASGNQVMRSAAERDKVSAELGGVLCFEMESAGLMSSFPCLVIRGICDYADSHKNKRWQPYAAATAAAFAKELLGVIKKREVDQLICTVSDLPTKVLLKLQRDASFNQLTTSETGSASVRLPYLSKSFLAVGQVGISGISTPTGNSCFELLQTLGFIHDTEDAGLSQFDEVPLHQLVFDERCYYTRASSEGILRLVCDHISYMRQVDASQVARTSIGTFTFSNSDLGKVLTFNSRERLPSTFRQGSYDLEDVRKYSAKSYLRRKGAYSLSDVDYTDFPATWESMPLRDAIWLCDLEPMDCPRFMSATDIQEIEFQQSFAREICRMVIPLMQSRSQEFHPMLVTLVQLIESKMFQQIHEFQYIRGTGQALLAAVLPGAGHNNRAFTDRCMDLYQRLESYMRPPANRQAFQTAFSAAAEDDFKLGVSLAVIACYAKANATFMKCRTVEASEQFIEFLNMPDFDLLMC